MKLLLFCASLLVSTFCIAQPEYFGGAGYPKVFNVQAYGAKHNGVQRFDGVCNGTTTFTSATGTFTSADVGKVIMIDSAGPSHVRLVDTIASVTNSTTVVLNTAASQTISGRMYVYGTDDTKAIQAAILDWYARGGAGIIYFPIGRYVINGPIVGNGYNCQIYIPTYTLPVASNQKDGIITLQGESPSAYDVSVLGLTNPPSNGVILHSFVDGTVVSGKWPTIIGSKWDSTNVANGVNYNYVDAYCNNMTFVVKANNSSNANGPAMGGLSFAEMINDGGDHVQANIDMPALNSVLPVNLTAGIITLTSNAATENRWTNTLCVGFRVGMFIGEHFSGDALQTDACWLGLNFEGSNHSAWIGRAIIQWSPHAMGAVYGYDGVGVFAQRVYADDIDIERYNIAATWYATVDDIYDSLNLFHGTIGLSCLKAGNTGVFLPIATGATASDFFYTSIYTGPVRQNAGGNVIINASTSPFTTTMTNSANTTTTQEFYSVVNSGGAYVHLGNFAPSYTTNGQYIGNAAAVIGSAKLVIASTSAPIAFATDGGASTTAGMQIMNSTNDIEVQGQGDTAALNLPPSTATRASIHIPDGAVPTTARNGDLYYRGGVYYGVSGGVAISLGGIGGGAQSTWVSYGSGVNTITGSASWTFTPSGGQLMSISGTGGSSSYIYQTSTNSASDASYYWDNNRGSFASYGGVIMGNSLNVGASLFGFARPDLFFILSGGASGKGMVVGTNNNHTMWWGSNSLVRGGIDSVGNMLLGNTLTDNATALQQNTSSSQPQVAWHYDATHYTTAQTNSSGNVAITPSGGNTSLVGSLNLTYSAKTATYGIGASDYYIDCTANSFTVTLPTAVGIAGRVYIIKNSGSSTTITIATTSSQTIDGSAPGTITTLTPVRVVSNGANWETF